MGPSPGAKPGRPARTTLRPQIKTMTGTKSLVRDDGMLVIHDMQSTGWLVVDPDIIETDETADHPGHTTSDDWTPK